MDMKTHSLMSFGLSKRLTVANLRVFLALPYVFALYIRVMSSIRAQAHKVNPELKTRTEEVQEGYNITPAKEKNRVSAE